MAKERALTLEALRVMDAIDRRGSFAAAADELGRVPSALSYTMQKLEEELDVVLFDRSGHRTKFTNVGRMLLERGRVLLEAADKLTTDAEALALTQESFAWMAEYDGDIPGASAVECGNYLMMDPVAARLECKAMSEVLQKLDADHMRYQEK